MDKPEEVIFEGGSFTQLGQIVEVEPFAMAKYPVTNQKYERFDPDHERCDESNQDNQPVVNVSWEDAVKYCQWLSKQTGEHYRLPTEAEWEFAASGGGQRIYPWGNEESNPERANYEMHIGETTPIGSYPLGMTPEGLFDMAGNVWEWCDDWYDEKQKGRVVRGGSFVFIRDILRCAARDWLYPFNRFFFMGFRVVRSLSSPSK